MIEYRETLDGITGTDLGGFFAGWPSRPTPASHLRILEGSDAVLLAVDRENDRVAGFITAITDGVISAYVPLLEVHPDYQGKGIGSELLTRMVDRFRHLYMVDLICDPDVQPFYDRLGLERKVGMARRSLTALGNLASG